MARVALVQVRDDNAFAKARAAIPPVGILSLAAFARKARPQRDEFRVWDHHFHHIPELAGEIEGFRPDLIGLSSLSENYMQVRELIARLRSRGIECPVILGGQLASSWPRVCLDMEGIDAIVQGEGELVFIDILDRLDRGSSLMEATGVTRLLNGEVVENERPEPMDDLDSLPTPAFDLMEIQRYHWCMGIGARMTFPPHAYLPLFTSRGCPFQCTYCHNFFGKKFRYQSAARVVETVEELYHRFGVTNFHVLDDVFNLETRRVMEFCSLMQRSSVPARFFFVHGLRGDRMDKAQIEALAAAGTAFMSVAFETASPRLQKEIRKNIDIDRVLETVEMGARQGIFMNGFFMWGFPGETRAEMEATFEVARISHLDHAFFFTVSPFPGTVLGDRIAATTRISRPDEVADFFSFPSNGPTLTAMSEEEVVQTVSNGLRRFWTPWRVASFFAHYPCLDDLMLFTVSPNNLRLAANWAVRRLGGKDPRIGVSFPAAREVPMGWDRRIARGAGRWLRFAAERMRNLLPPPPGSRSIPGS